MKKYLRRYWKAVAIFILLVLFVVWPYLAPKKYYVSLMEQFFVVGLFAVSLGFMMGFVGLTSLGHAAFFGVAAYITAIFSVKLGLNVMFSALLGIVGVVIVGLIMGLCTSRMRGMIFMMVTVAFSQIFWGVALQWSSLTGGDNGIAGVPRPVIAGIKFSGIPLYYLLLGLFIICVVLLTRIANTPFGLAMRGIKESESRMRVLGYNVRRMKILAVTISGFFAGIAGIMWVWFNSFVGTNDLAVLTSSKAIIMVLTGGVGTITGPIVGAFVIVILESIISGFTERWLLVMGVLYIVVVLFLKGGIVGITKRLVSRVQASNRKLPGHSKENQCEPEPEQPETRH